LFFSLLVDPCVHDEYRVRKEDAYGHRLAGQLDFLEKSQLLRSLAARAHFHRPDHLPRGTSRRAASMDETKHEK
jgi:hypothetical protein